MGVIVLGITAVLLASNARDVQILRHFPGLRRAGTGWQAVFYIHPVRIVAAILGAYVLAAAGGLTRLR